MSSDEEDNKDKDDLTSIESLGQYEHTDEDLAFAAEQEAETANEDPSDSADTEEDQQEEALVEFEATSNNIDLEDAKAAESDFTVDEDSSSEFSFDASDDDTQEEAEAIEENQEESAFDFTSEEETPAEEPLEEISADPGPGPGPEPESGPEAIPESGPEPITDPIPELGPEPLPDPIEATPAIKELKEEAPNIQFTSANPADLPPFTLILKNILYRQDAEEIAALLVEYKIIDENQKASTLQSMEAGQLLIPRVSEYVAIFLSHRFRAFNLDILVGHAEEIYPPKSYAKSRPGLVDKHSYRPDTIESIQIEEGLIDPKQIILSTSPYLHGKEILRYLGIIHSSTYLNDQDMMLMRFETKSEQELLYTETDGEGGTASVHVSKDESKNYPHIYHILAEKLRPKALALKGNAIIGIHFQLTPVPKHRDVDMSNATYKLDCTGNVVWAQ